MIGGPDNPCVFQQVTARRRTIEKIKDFTVLAVDQFQQVAVEIEVIIFLFGSFECP